jgi:four helix bundle protein
MNRHELQKRLIDFAVSIVHIIEKLPKTVAGKHLGGQLLRSGSSPALNYGEAQGAESKKDFKHKMSVCLKELRETHVNLLIIQKAGISRQKESLQPVINECDELISIFVKSIKTLNNGRGG